jgi:hypothetical protein
MSSLSRPQLVKSRRHRRWTIWLERVMAILALINLILVIGDLTYIRFRDRYLLVFPELTIWYGEKYKGIEPNRETTAYLETVNQLEAEVAESGLQATETQEILADLRAQSVAIVTEDPFQIANKSGTLERIKYDMMERVGVDNSQVAFQTFWSVDYLTENGWSEEIAFFKAEIEPQIETNYFRRIGFDGAPIDWFWKIDIWFILIFGVELLGRTLYLSRHYKNLTWGDALLWRWYDLLLIIPFSGLHVSWLALSRIIPVSIRLNQSRTINLEPFWGRVNRFFVSQIAVEVTEVVVLRIIDQAQNLIRQGEIADWLLSRSQRRYIGVNDINEVQAISKELSSVMVYRVLPKIKPDLDALLYHNIHSMLYASPAYRSIHHLPGMKELPDQLTHQLSKQFSDSLLAAVQDAFEDERGAELFTQLLTNLVTTLQLEVQSEKSVEEIEDLTLALLEEIKINYVKRIAAEDIDQLNEQRYHIYDVTQESNPRS